MGTKATRLNVNQSLNYIPLADLPYTPNFTANTTAPGGGGAATNSFLGTSVVNPFTVPTQYAAANEGHVPAGLQGGTGPIAVSVS